MKYKNKPTGNYRSGLEKICGEELLKAGLDFKYEAERFTILDKFKYPSWERVSRKGKKVFMEVYNVSKITYTYDFSGNYKGIDWIIETKGKRTSTFNNKWKLFKQRLSEENRNVLLLMPSTKYEILQSIKLIKEYAVTKEKEIATSSKSYRTRTESHKVKNRRRKKAV